MDIYEMEAVQEKLDKLSRRIDALAAENRELHRDMAALIAVMDTDISRLKALAGDDIRLAGIVPLKCCKRTGAARRADIIAAMNAPDDEGDITLDVDWCDGMGDQ